MSMTVPAYWDAAKAHLRRIDPIMGGIIDRHEDPPLRSKGRVFETLVHSIVGQQISAKAADAVWGRFVELVGEINPEQVSAQNPDTLRQVGLSRRKVEYILGLATVGSWVVDHPWSERSDDDVRADLVTLRGVGPWTADMVLMFSLLRPETLESLFVLWRVTKNATYRDWGWAIFEAFERHARLQPEMRGEKTKTTCY